MTKEPHRYPRGAIVLVNLDRAKGQRKAAPRPCVIVTDAGRIRASRAPLLYGVVPLTARSTAAVGDLVPRLSAREGGLPAAAMALCVHVRSVAPERITGYVGQLDDDEMMQVETALKYLFEISNWVIPEDWQKHEVSHLLHTQKTEAGLRREIARLYDLEIEMPDEPTTDQP